MWRYLAGMGAVLLLAVAGIFAFRGGAATRPLVPPVPAARAAAAADTALPDEAPRASDRTREQKRFDRYDKDRNELIAREEYLASRRKAFGKLDADGDGRLSFGEWAAKTTAKFVEADQDKSGTMTRAEFLTTAPKRRTAKAACACAPAAPVAARDEGEE
ncbi:EF-hand domain-containing protein [Sphingomonas hengshuiensis]|uniref:Histidine kinase n=1 Tax=Sphingomonas hengshuiensis TaxID=1609977 RepID=A0A7U4J765_9SPHN|nr:histidine kinase [Sphingomonas hengshuiensis]AJP71506.1 histidine kinase [Sphingomonas hengshuiensis]